MSSHPHGGHRPPTKPTSIPVANSTKKILIETPPQALHACLDALLSQDGTLKDITRSTLQLVTEAKTKMGEADALFISGLLLMAKCAPISLLTEAAEKGCKHPILPYVMGECYRLGKKGIIASSEEALMYYGKSIRGGCTWGYRAVYDMYSKGCDEIKGNDRKPLTYLSDLVREGHTDAWIRGLIGECYARGVGCAQDPRVAMLYYVHGIEEGYTSAYKPLLDLLAGIKFHTQSKGHKAMLAQVIAEERKVILDDDRIVALLLRLMLDRHVDFHPKPKELGRFQTKGTAALYYANILIQRGSPVGYLYKGEVYMYGHADLSDWSKAVSIWEEADRQGKANFEIYYKHLQDVYKYGQGVLVNGRKVIEYGDKALQLQLTDQQVIDVVQKMAEVYTKGLKPIAQDGTEALKCYEKGINKVKGLISKARLNEKMAEVYKNGLPPVPPDPVKASEYFKKAGMHWTPDRTGPGVRIFSSDDDDVW